jgi:hypothetical protein
MPLCFTCLLCACRTKCLLCLMVSPEILTEYDDILLSLLEPLIACYGSVFIFVRSVVWTPFQINWLHMRINCYTMVFGLYRLTLSCSCTASDKSGGHDAMGAGHGRRRQRLWERNHFGRLRGRSFVGVLLQ